MRRRTGIVVVLVLGVLLLAAGIGTVAVMSRPRPGAPGLGDPYTPALGNGGYEVDAYDITLRYAPADGSITATTTVSASVTSGPLSSLDLDLQGLTVDGVTVDGRPVAWSRSGVELVVPLPNHPRAGDHVVVAVDYHGVPEAPTSPALDGPAGWRRTSDGAVVVAQPDGASTWFPCNDHPSDKAMVDVTLVTPPGTVGVANGLPDEPTTTADGWTSTTWRSDSPMATYLVTVAVGDYEVRRSTLPGGLPVIEALGRAGPRPPTDDAEELGRLGEILAFLESVLGPYPFASTGAVVSSDPLGFALEDQTRPVYSQEFFVGRSHPGAADVIAHELAHQWLGDRVTVARWDDIWLNEGWATYLEWMWSEHDGGPTVAQRYAELACRQPDDEGWTIPPGDPGPEDMFSPPVYDRGAMTVHTLRETVGDDAFGEIVHRWVEADQMTPRTTADLVALADEVSGKNLDALFTTWLDLPGKPAGLACDPAPSTPPTAPTDVTATPGPDPGTVTLAWEPPVSAGGAPLLGYDVDVVRDGAQGTTVVLPPQARTWTAVDLPSGDRLRLVVAARNRVGAGPDGSAVVDVP